MRPAASAASEKPATDELILGELMAKRTDMVLNHASGDCASCPEDLFGNQGKNAFVIR